jgi:hypothetical protein
MESTVILSRFTPEVTVCEDKREEKESEEGYPSTNVNPLILFKTFFQRVIDDDRLGGSCWNLEMREVELWENEIWRERFIYLFLHQFPFFNRFL